MAGLLKFMPLDRNCDDKPVATHWLSGMKRPAMAKPLGKQYSGHKKDLDSNVAIGS